VIVLGGKTRRRDGAHLGNNQSVMTLERIRG
jgi:hypothetical protein